MPQGLQRADPATVAAVTLRLSLLLLLAGLWLGCGRPSAQPLPPPVQPAAAGPRQPPSGTAVAMPSGPLPRAVVHFEQLGGKPFPYPLARVTVRGEPTWLIIDTGTSHHVLGGWLARRLGMLLEPSGQAGRGHAGEVVRTFEVSEPRLSLEGWGALEADAVLVVELPPVFEELGLGGVLSPQTLAPADHVVWLDLRSNELRLIRWPQLPAAGDALLLASGPQHVCPVQGASTSALFVVEAVVEGRVAQLAIDTGALRTDLMAGAAAALPLLGRSVEAEASYTAGGTVRSRRVADVSVVVGGIAHKLDLGLIPGQPVSGCQRDGHLALDVLRGCGLALSPWRFAVWCDR